MVVCFGRPAFQTFHDKECVGIFQCKVIDRFIGAAQEIVYIAAIELYGSFPQVTFFCGIADRNINIFVHSKTS